MRNFGIISSRLRLGASTQPAATRDEILPRDPDDLLSDREALRFGLAAFASPFVIAGICLILISWFG